MKRDYQLDFDQVYRAYYKLLVAFADKYMKDINDSEEIVQLFFTDFYEKRSELKITQNIKSYLYQSIYHRCLNQLKENKKFSHQEPKDVIDESYSIESSIEATEFEHQVYLLINKLPKACREVFTLSRFKNYSNDQIAEHKGISKRTVETQISNALKFLRKEIKALNADDNFSIKLYSFFF